MKITREFLLTEPKACKPQVELFDAVFPDGAELTLKNLVVAREAGLELGWFITNKLCSAAQTECEETYNQAWTEYKKVRDPAWAEYQKTRDPERAEYEKRDPAWVKYKKTCDPMWTEYEKARDRALIVILKKHLQEKTT